MVDPKNSLKYACMDVGFRHRPIPRGQTKRSAFCDKCGAPRCVLYPEMRPVEVRRRKRMPTQYPKRKIVWAFYKAGVSREPEGVNARRDIDILVHRRRGEPMQAIAERHGITRQRVYQIVKAGEK